MPKEHIKGIYLGNSTYIDCISAWRAAISTLKYWTQPLFSTDHPSYLNVWNNMREIIFVTTHDTTIIIETISFYLIIITQLSPKKIKINKYDSNHWINKPL